VVHKTHIICFKLDHRDHKVSPTITRVNLGEIAVFTCHTDREALWFLHFKQIFNSVSVKTYGMLNQHIEINEIKKENIGIYCCYGHDETNNSYFLACTNLVLLGN